MSAARSLEEAQRILAAPVGSLTALKLGSFSAAGPQVVQLLLASGHPPQLKSLDLTATSIGAEGLAALVTDPSCAGLETLILGGVEARSIGARIRHDKKWAAMVTCDVDDAGLAAVIDSPWLKSLRRLDLSYTIARPETWARFAASDLVSRLTHFGAAMTSELSRVAWCTIVERATALEGLGLRCSDFGDEGVQALIRAGQGARRLELALSGLTLAGVRELLNAPFPKLEWLDLRGVPIDEALFTALLTRTGTKALRTVVLNEQTVIPTGAADVWYDQGMVVGESEGMFWLYAVDLKRFVAAKLNVTSVVERWPRGWMA